MQGEFPLAEPRGGHLFVAGIDPGAAQAGHALLHCGRLSGGVEVLDCGVVVRPGGASMGAVMDHWRMLVLDVLGKRNCFVAIHVAVEGQWTPHVDEKLTKQPEKLLKSMAGIASTVEVAANRGAWVALAEHRGWLADVIHPSSWRTGLGRGGRGKRQSVKQLAIEAVRWRQKQLFRRIRPPARVPDHMAEAIHIGEYQAKKLQVENLRKASEA